MKAAAVLRRPDLERAQEDAAHRLGGAEATGRGHRCDRIGRVLELAARGFQAHPLDVPGRSDAGLGPKGAGEVA